MEGNFPKPLFDWCETFPFPKTERPSWDNYFLLMAFIASRRSSCLRKKVGAVIVYDKAVISTGYNGSPNHQKNCIEIGNCYRDVSFQNKLKFLYKDLLLFWMFYSKYY